MGRHHLVRLLAALRSAPLRSAVVLGLDALATLVAFFAALAIRFGTEVPAGLGDNAWMTAGLLVVTRLSCLTLAGLHRWSFRMSGLAEAVRLAVVCAVGTVAFLAIHQLTQGWNVPRTIIALELFGTLTLAGGFRFAPQLASLWYSEQLRTRSGAVQRTIIVGAGCAGDLLLRELLRSSDHSYKVVGFLDDDPAKIGTFIGGRPVLGAISELPAVIAQLRVQMVMLAIPRLPAGRIREILSLCSKQKARFKIVPASFARLNAQLTSAMLHDLSPEDLLPRDEVAFDGSELHRLVEGRRIMITGGAGSIGGEIASQVTRLGAATVVLVDMNENGLYLLARRLRETCPGTDVRTEVADVRDAARLRRLGEQYRPQYVFHAAAHKHVPLMEEAPEEAVHNNVLGTLNVARMADACDAEKLVFISTDKAVKPSSVMGVSKRVGELIVRDLARSSRTRMTAVRFGNVLGSAGSVLPIFKEQIERGGPVTVTHPDCSRYFMTIPEAVGLVLLAGLGGHDELCVLDMGEPINIAEMARNLITMAGYIPDVEIPIAYTGLRPGEKLHEELLTEEEERTETVRGGIRAAVSPAPPADLHVLIEELQRRADLGDRDGILDTFRKIVPTYTVTRNDGSEPEPRGGGRVIPLRVA